MDLSQFSAQIHEARADIAAGDLVMMTRPTAAILLFGQGLGEVLQALAAHNGLRLNPAHGARTWGEQFWERGMLPSWDEVRDDVGQVGIMVRHIQVPFDDGQMGEIGAPHALFVRATVSVVEGLAVRAVETRAGPLKAAVEAAAERIRQADMELKSGLKPWAVRRAGAVMRFKDSAAEAVKVLWIKGDVDELVARAGGHIQHGQSLADRWSVLEEGGLVPSLRPSMRAMLRDLEKLDNRAKKNFLPRSVPNPEPITEDEVGFAEQVATRVLNVAKDILADDLAPLALPEPPGTGAADEPGPT